MKHRVVITGIGLATPVGRGVQQFWNNLLAGRSGIGPISLFDASALPIRIGGEVKNLDQPMLAKKFPAAIDEKDRKVWLGLDAASQAIVDAYLCKEDFDASLLFTGVSLETFFLDYLAPVAHEPNIATALAQRVFGDNQCQRLQTPLDQLTQVLGEAYQISSGCYTNCSACAAGAQAIGEAFLSLREGDANLALAGATDSTLNPLGLGGFSLLHILSTENDTPQTACRPFDVTRQGTVLSEGAAFLVLENLEHAQRRQARIYAEVIGYASSLDAYRVTDPEPDGRGAALSMSKAIADAGIEIQAVDGINAHGTGTPKNDVAETMAIKKVLGKRAFEIPVTANKSMTGHMIATSGAAEAAASALSLYDGQFPPTINLRHPDPQCDLDYVKDCARPFAGRIILSNSFGFGGQNATLLFKKYE